LLAIAGVFLLSGCQTIKTNEINVAEKVVVVKKLPHGYSEIDSGEISGTNYVTYNNSGDTTVMSFTIDIKPIEVSADLDQSRQKAEDLRAKNERLKPRIRAEGTLPVAGRTLRYQIVKHMTKGEELSGTIEPTKNNLEVHISCDSTGEKLDLTEVKEFLACVKEFKD